MDIVWFILSAGLGLMVGGLMSRMVDYLPKRMEQDWRQFAEEYGQQSLEPSQPITFWQHHQPTPYALPVCLVQCFSSRLIVVEQVKHKRQYVVLELLTSVLFAVFFWQNGFASQTLFAWALVVMLLTAAWIDWQTQYLPDQITLTLLWFGLLWNSADGMVGLNEAVWGAAVGYGFLYAVNAVYHRLRGVHGIGGGDYKLLAALGACFGVNSLLIILLMASVAGLLLAGALRATKNQALPFGPALALAGLLYLQWQPDLSYWLGYHAI